LTRPEIGLHKKSVKMDKKSKFILGLETKRYSSSMFKKFTEEEKRFIIEDYLSSGKTKVDIWYKYTGYHEEHGSLLRWMRQLGYDTGISPRIHNFASNSLVMKKKESTESFETLQLQKRIEELEKRLQDAEMKAIAFSTMVDIAEEEFNIPIRKKLNTKASKK
jgi:transposase